jgi:DNA invertase Pin-like site-specific DNA recombinase
MPANESGPSPELQSDEGPTKHLPGKARGMKKSISLRGLLIPAVGYVRRSTEKQEKSLDDQRREIERYAASHGYQIVRWYEDDGISGDDTERRKGFLAMHHAACNGRDFEAILVWDQDRFGRFNSLEAGHWVFPLTKAGVQLVTVTEGPINWNDFTGRVVYSLKQEGKHQFLVDLSRNTARGQITNAQNGFLCGQAAPYGYDRMLVDERGEHCQRIRNGQQIARPRSWHVTLVPSEDVEKIKTLRWLFERYADTDVGVRQLVDSLNERKIPGPGGAAWWFGTVREILRNPAYKGDFVWARRRIGKYHRVAKTEIKARNDGGGAQHNPCEEWIVKHDAHEALVDRETFDRVQVKLAERKKRSSSHKKTNGDCYLLSGIVHCAHCGRKMHGSRLSRKKDGRVYEYRKFVCSTYQQTGRNNPEGCGCHGVDQGDLLRLLLRKLRLAIGADDNRDNLRQRVLKRLRSQRIVDPKRANGLRSKVAELDREIEQGTRRLLRAPDDVADLLAIELRKVRGERERVAVELATIDTATKPIDVEGEAERVTARLDSLSADLNEKVDPAKLREVVRRMVDRIDLFFDRVPRGKRVECPLSKGVINLRRDSAIFSLECRGDWI